MPNEKKDTNIAVFAILTTLTIFVWIGTEVYRILNKTSLENVPAAVLAPLDPTLDTTVLSDIEKRLYFPEETLTSAVASPSPTLVPSPTATPTQAASTQSAQTTPTP